jgi:glycosyltransferase involved in cell wall biosynthesis
MKRLVVLLRRRSKKYTLELWKFFINFIVALNLKFLKKRRNSPKVFFSGALPGHRGGPRVKVSRLRERFRQRPLGFDVLYVLSNYPYLSVRSVELCRRSNTPIVLNQNGVHFPGWFGQDFALANSQNKLIYENSAYVFWQSLFAREGARLFLSPYDPPGEILYNAVDLNFYKPTDERKSKNSFRLLVAGKFTPDTFYQVRAALHGISLCPPKERFELIVAGLSNSQKILTQILCSDLGLTNSVQLLGPFEQSKAPELMSSVDCYLALKHMDTCPNLVIEALASGVPVIYSNSGGTPELVGSEAGIPLQVDKDWDCAPIAPNIELIAEAIQEVRWVKDKMGKAARERAEGMFDISYWYLRHAEIFRLVREEK